MARARSTAANRLTFDDDLFVRTGRALGLPVVNQVVWELPGPPDVDAARRFARALSAGPMNRVVVPARVPGARSSWARSPEPVPLVVRDDVVEDLQAWADAEADVTLDPQRPGAVRLVLAPRAGGDSVLSLVGSHALFDGGLLLTAVSAAVDGTPLPALPEELARRPSLLDDAREACSRVRLAVRGLLRRPTRVPPSPGLQDSAGIRLSVREERPPGPAATMVVVDCPSEEWLRAADREGGSANTLLVALTAELSVRAGRAVPGDVRVAVPVSGRTGPSDVRGNATKGVSVAVTVHDDGRARPGDVRGRLKEQLRSLADGTRPDPMARLEPLAQMLPDAVVRRLAAAQHAPLALASNLGELPSSFCAPTGTAARRVLMRSGTRGADVEALRRTRGGVSTWWLSHAGTSTFAVLSLDPDAFVDRAELLAAVHDVCAGHGLAVKPW